MSLAIKIDKAAAGFWDAEAYAAFMQCQPQEKTDDFLSRSI